MIRTIHTRLSAALALAVWMLLPHAALAQDSAEAPEAAQKRALQAQETEIAEAYETLAGKILNRYIEPASYSVQVRVFPSEGGSWNMPYAPGWLRPALASMSASELREHVAKVEVSVMFAKVVGQETRRRLVEILTSRLNLDEKQGDKISQGELGIEVGKPETQIERELSQALVQLKAAESATADQKRKLEKAEERLQTLQEGRPFFERHAATVAVVLASISLLFALLIAFLGTRAIGGIGTQMVRGAEALAQAVESVGGQIGQSREQGASQESAKATQERTAEAGGRGLATMSLADLQRRLAKLSEELMAAMRPSNESVVLSCLNDWASDPAQVSRAVALMELIGKDRATELAAKLSAGANAAIARFLRGGTYERPKGEVMVEAGETLKTRLLGGEFERVSGALAGEIESRLLRLDDEELARIFLGLDGAYVPRLFLFLRPERAVAVMSHIAKVEPARVEVIGRLLINLPAARLVEDKDQDLLKQIDSMITESSNDIYKPFLALFKELVERSDDEVAERLVGGLGQEERLSEFLGRNVVTFGQFFQLTSELQGRVLEGFGLKDLALLLSQMQESERQPLVAMQSERRREMLLEEMDTLAAATPGWLAIRSRKVKSQVVARMKEMRDRGELEIVTKRGKAAANGSQDASGSDQGKGANAA